MTDLSITREDQPTRGRYVVEVDGQEAELTFSKMESTGNIIADHTGVPDELSGRGIGTALVKFMIDDARANNFRIVPLCPFIKAQFQRHPEWGDVMM